MTNYFAPTNMVRFIQTQFARLSINTPPVAIIEDVAELMVDILIQTDYFPRTPSEARWRFENPSTGLTDEEKQKLLSPIFAQILTKYKTEYNVIHLTTWAALMWCWSEEGEFYVRQRDPASARIQRQRFQSSLHQAQPY
jgi:hypothetical protein